MGKGIVYCSVCGDRILERDFDKGRAVTVLGRSYCRKCSKDVVKKSAKKEETGEPAGPAPPPRKRQTQRIPFADKPAAPPRKPAIPMGFIIAIVVGIAALILLFVVMSRSGPPR